MSSIGIDIRNIGKKRTGDEVVFFNLVKKLAIIDDFNQYKLFTDITDEKVLEQIKSSLGIVDKPNFEVVSIPTGNRFIWNFWTLAKYLRQNPIDIYLTQYITPFFIPKKINPHTKNPLMFLYKKLHDRFFGVGVKIVTIIHDISFKVFPQFIKKSDLFFLNLLIPISLRRATKIIGASRFTASEIIKYYKVDPQKVDWIHNAVSDNFETNISEEDKKRIREKYNLPEKFILYLGTLQPRKNLPTLVEAIHELPVQNRNLKLVLAGGKGHNYDTRIDEIIEKYSLEQDVILPGFIDEKDKPIVISLAEIFCFPSFYEGFGIPILEAMSLSVPVIASKIPPHEEITEGATLLFDPHNSSELARKISEILSNDELRRNLIEKGREQVKKFSWLRTAEKMKGIFESM